MAWDHYAIAVAVLRVMTFKQATAHKLVVLEVAALGVEEGRGLLLGVLYDELVRHSVRARVVRARVRVRLGSIHAGSIGNPKLRSRTVRSIFQSGAALWTKRCCVVRVASTTLSSVHRRAPLGIVSSRRLLVVGQSHRCAQQPAPP